ncbi:MAG: DUF4785 domain-containing protein [Acidobacteriota bacterium]
MNMKTTFSIPAVAAQVLLASSLLLSGPVAGQDRGQIAGAVLLPMGEADFAPDTLVRIDAGRAQLPGVSLEPVSFTYPLPAEADIDGPGAPFETRSREYWTEVGGDELRAGVVLHVSSPRALVRLNPAGSAQVAGLGETHAISPETLVLTVDGESHAGGTGMELLVDAGQLRAAGAPFVDGTSAFRIRGDLGVGPLTLSAPELRAVGERFVIHVFEPESELSLDLVAGRADYFHGDTLTVTADLGGLALRRVEGYVISPAGRAWPVVFERAAEGRYVARLQLDALEAPGQGLWEVHMAASAQRDDLTVIRNGRAAFACHLPTAGLTGEASVQRRRDGSLGATFGVSAASGGRYEVRGLLYGTDGAGKLRPMAIGHAAAWFEDEGRLTLDFDGGLIKASGLSAPFEIRDLRLLDQGRMGQLHRQGRALVIDR